MKLTAIEEYGLRCLLQMARHEESDSMSVPEIAEKEGLSEAYVSKLMKALRAGGLVESTRGQKGGYMLARPSGEISLKDVFVSLSGGVFEQNHCDRHTGNQKSCVHNSDCAIRSTWNMVEDVLGRVLGGITLKNMVRSENSMGEFLGSAPARKGALTVLQS